MASTTELQPSIIVIFGVTGDLSQRYLLPALYHLFKDDLLHEHTRIIGLTRQDMQAADLFSKVELCMNETDNICEPEALHKMLDKTSLFQFDPAKPEDYPRLLELLNTTEDEQGMCMNRLYYLSIPPNLFETTVNNIASSGLNKSCQHGTAETRLLVEKPFGSDLHSARMLIDQTNAVFAEEQVFRIDHYLAKQTVQNILTFRANNPIFASIWHRANIETIDILAYEKIGIEGRANFYEGVGALRDLVQSHLLQLLAITTMELPSDVSDTEAIHTNKKTLFEAVQPADPTKAIRGQYDSYKQEVSNDSSTTETYVRVPLAIDNERWKDVAVTITTGKALPEKRTEVIVSFGDPSDASDSTNVLKFRIQPNEGIHLELRVKKPSFEDELQDAIMDFSYAQTFGQGNHPDAYERVLVDAVRGDRTLFATSDEVLLSWRIIEPLLTAWKNNADGLQGYVAGSDGPANKLSTTI